MMDPGCRGWNNALVKSHPESSTCYNWRIPQIAETLGFRGKRRRIPRPCSLKFHLFCITKFNEVGRVRRGTLLFSLRDVFLANFIDGNYPSAIVRCTVFICKFPQGFSFSKEPSYRMRYFYKRPK